MSEHANNKKQQSKKREHNRDDGDDKDVYNDDSQRRGKNAQGIYSFFTSPPPLPQAYQEISCESLIPLSCIWTQFRWYKVSLCILFLFVKYFLLTTSSLKRSGKYVFRIACLNCSCFSIYYSKCLVSQGSSGVLRTSTFRHSKFKLLRISMNSIIWKCHETQCEPSILSTFSTTISSIVENIRYLLLHFNVASTQTQFFLMHCRYRLFNAHWLLALVKVINAQLMCDEKKLSVRTTVCVLFVCLAPCHSCQRYRKHKSKAWDFKYNVNDKACWCNKNDRM